MSKPLYSFSVLALLAISGIFANGQDIDVTIGLDFKTPVIAVQGQHRNSDTSVNRRNLSFLRSVSGVDNLAGRVSEMQLSDSTGKALTVRKLMDGEYLSETDFARWSYMIDVTPPKNRTAAAHVSWFADGTGILMLADLLPRFDTK